MGEVVYDSTNDCVVVRGYKNSDSKEPWTIKAIYDALASTGKVEYDKNPNSASAILVVKCHMRITGGGEIDDEHPNFVMSKWDVLWVEKSFIVDPDAFVKLGDEDDPYGEGQYGVNGPVLAAGHWYDVAWGSGPGDWQCVQFRGKARIYGAVIFPQDGRFSVTDDADVIVKDSVIWNSGRFASSNLRLIRTKVFKPDPGDFCEFTKTPAELSEVEMQNMDYLMSFYQAAGKQITVTKPKFIDCRNAWSLPDCANANLHIVDAQPLPDPTRVTWVRGWNMDEATVHFKFTLTIKVVDDSGSPIDNAVVSIIDAKGNVMSNVTNDEGVCEFVVTSFKAITRTSDSSDADVILGPFDHDYYWHVWVFTPFKIVVWKEGFATYSTTTDIRQPTQVLAIIQPREATSGLTVVDLTDDLLSFAHSWSGETHLKCFCRVKNATNASIVMTPSDLLERELFVKVPREIYSRFENIRVSEAVEMRGLAPLTQVDANTWRSEFESEDFSCDFERGHVQLLEIKLSISQYDPNCRIRLRAYSSDDDYVEDERTLKEWHIWRAGSFRLTWAICASRNVHGSPDLTNIRAIEVYIEDPSKVSIANEVPTKIVTNELPRERYKVVDRGAYGVLLWWDEDEVFRIDANSERYFVITINPTPILDSIREIANRLSGDSEVQAIYEQAKRASFYYELLQCWDKLLSVLRTKCKDVMQGIDAIDGKLSDAKSAIDEVKAKTDRLQFNDDNRVVATLNGEKVDLVDDLRKAIEFVKSVEGGRWKIENCELILFAEDNETEIARFKLLDKSGQPSETEVFERVRVQ